MGIPMDRNLFSDTQASLHTLVELRLIVEEERAAAITLLAIDSPWAAYVDAVESIHIHVKVVDVLDLPINEFFDAGARLDHQKLGFVKYRFPGGLNAIFSEPRVGVEDSGAERVSDRLPYVDHIGFDLRDPRPSHRQLFDALPQVATEQHCAIASQGGEDGSVACCYAKVAAKHWLFPKADKPFAGMALEFAFGPITLTPDAEGADHRPNDPLGESAGACCGG